MKIAHLYKRSEMEIPINDWYHHSVDSDGINVYRCVFVGGIAGADTCKLTVYGFYAESDFKQYKVVYQSTVSKRDRVVRIYYSERTKNTYIVLSSPHVDYRMLNIILICNGVTCHQYLMTHDRFCLSQCKYNDYYDNIVMGSIKDGLLTEYYIDDTTNTIQNKSYTCSRDIGIIHEAFSTGEHIYVISDHNINIINRSADDARIINFHTGHNESGMMLLSEDAKYLYAAKSGIITIYKSTSLEKMLLSDQQYRVLGSVNGFIISNSCKDGLSEMIYRNNRPYAMVSNGIHNDLTICPAGAGLLISSVHFNRNISHIDIYDFVWRWNNFKLQCRRIRDEAVYIYMTLKRLGIYHHLCLLISAMAMTR